MKRLYRSKDNRVLCAAWLYGERPDRLYCGGRHHTGRIIR